MGIVQCVSGLQYIGLDMIGSTTKSREGILRDVRSGEREIIDEIPALLPNKRKPRFEMGVEIEPAFKSLLSAKSITAFCGPTSYI